MSHAQIVPPARGRRIAVSIGLLVVAAAATVATAVAALSNRLPGAVLVPALIVLISAVDLVASVAAKSWATTSAWWVFLVGAALYILAFWIFAQSLRYGELSVVTVGWVAVVCVGSMVLDRFRYGAQLPASKWVAAAAVIVLLGYLMVDSGSSSGDPSDAGGAPARLGAGTHA